MGSEMCIRDSSKCLKTAILPLKLKNGLKVEFFEEIAILRHLEWILEKSEESRPPLKLKNNGGLLSDIFSKNHSRCFKMAISLKF